MRDTYIMDVDTRQREINVRAPLRPEKLSSNGKIYVNDSEYDELQGRVVAETRTKVGVLEDGQVLVRVVQVIDIGRGEPVEPAPLEDPEEDLSIWRRPSEDDVEGRIVDFLTAAGSSTIDQIVAGTRLKRTKVAEHLGRKRGIARCINRRRGLWALPSQP